MAFIRRVRTASGATAVQIAEYAGGRQRIVKHVGSAHTEAELGVLLQRALLEDPAQGVLDLGIEPAPRVVSLVPPASDPELFKAAEATPTGGRAGSGRVVATDSRVLFDALAGVFTALGFDALGDEVLRDLVIARVVEPSSLLDAGRVLRNLGTDPVSYATMKRTLGRATAGKYRDQVATWCFGHASTSGDIPLVLYDVTTLYFEAELEDDLRRSGTPRNAGSIHRSSWVCWWTVADSRWRSAASKSRQRHDRMAQSCREIHRTSVDVVEDRRFPMAKRR